MGSYSSNSRDNAGDQSASDNNIHNMKVTHEDRMDYTQKLEQSSRNSTRSIDARSECKHQYIKTPLTQGHISHNSSTDESTGPNMNLVLEREVASLKEIVSKYCSESKHWKAAYENKSKEYSLSQNELSNARYFMGLFTSLRNRCDDLCAKTDTIQTRELKSILSMHEMPEVAQNQDINTDVVNSLKDKTRDLYQEINLLNKELESTTVQYKHSKELIASLECLVEEKGNMVKDMYMDSKGSLRGSISLRSSSESYQQVPKQGLLKNKSVQVNIVPTDERNAAETISSLSASLEDAQRRNKTLLQRLSTITQDLSHSKELFRQKCTQIITQQKIHNVLRKKCEQDMERAKFMDKDVAELRNTIEHLDESNSEKDAELKELRQSLADLQGINAKLNNKLSQFKTEFDSCTNNFEPGSKIAEELENTIKNLRSDLEKANYKTDESVFLESTRKDQMQYIERMEDCIKYLGEKNCDLKEENKKLNERFDVHQSPLANIINYVIDSSLQPSHSDPSVNLEQTGQQALSSNESSVEDISKLKKGQLADYSTFEEQVKHPKFQDTDTIDRTYIKGIVLNLIKVEKFHRPQMLQVLGSILGFSQNELSLLKKIFS